jgi:hypothetical protein
MSHTHRSPLRSGIARTLRYAPRSARAELGRVTARRVRRAALRVLHGVAVGRLDVEAVAWPVAREVCDAWAFD